MEKGDVDRGLSKKHLKTTSSKNHSFTRPRKQSFIERIFKQRSLVSTSEAEREMMRMASGG